MITAHATTFDATDAAALAGFWAEVLGQPDDPGASPEFASIGMQTEAAPNGKWMFIRVPEAKTAKNRVHVDFVTAEDLDVEAERLVGLGATRHDTHQEGTIRWTTLTDPEGNEFDVAVEVPAT